MNFATVNSGSHRSPAMTKASVLALLIVCVSAFSQTSAATDTLPPAGSAAYKTVYVGVVLSSMKTFDNRSVELRELTGLTRSEPPSSHYSGLSARCLVYFESTAKLPRINGTCTLMDRDGDQIFQRFGAGKISILSGTGKYSGISGAGAITKVKYFPSQSDNSRQFEVSHQIDWSIQ